jgi:hypothetical protein
MAEERLPVDEVLYVLDKVLNKIFFFCTSFGMLLYNKSATPVV